MEKNDVKDADSMAESRARADELIEKNANRNGWQEGSPADDLMEMIILDSCGGDMCKKLAKNKMLYSVEFLAENLPAVAFVSEFYLELIIHGGILAKDDYNQKKLDEWLEKRNILGQTNGNVIREALLNSIIYGYAGMRKVLGNLVYVSPNNFRIWKLPATDENGDPIPGIKAPLFYEVLVKADEKVDKENKEHVFAVDNEKYTLNEVIKEKELKKAPDGSYYVDDGLGGVSVSSVYIPVENFCHLRHSDDGDYGKSPLTTDRLRTTLIVDYLKNVIDEVNNDGNDYMMYLKQRTVAGASLSSSFSTDDVDIKLTSSSDAKQTKTAREKQMAAARQLAQKLKRTAKTRIGIIDESWVDKIERLEGTVKLKEYLTILDDAKGVVADIYGIPAMLAGSSGGGWSTGMSSLIPFTLERTIKPFQQRYADQLSRIIRECADIKGDVHFKEINWEDEKTAAEIEKIKAETEKLLAEANKATADKAKVSKETKLLTSDGVNGRNQQTNTQPSTQTKTSKSKKKN